MVWIQVCHIVEFERNCDCTWKWKYVMNTEENVDPIYVPINISYLELYNNVQQLVKFDINVYAMELMSLNPNMARFPVPPMKIDSDNKLMWYLSICEEHRLCVTLVKKVAEKSSSDSQFIDCSGSGLVNEERVDLECFDSGSDFVQNDNDAENARVGGNLVDWSTLNVIEESPVIQDVRCTISMIEGDRPNFWAQHAPVTNASCFVSSPPRLSSVKIPECEDLKRNDLFPTKLHLVVKLSMLSLRCHFEYKVVKATKSPYTIVCIDARCNWLLRAVRIKGTEIFEIRKYLGHHTCSMIVRRKDHKHATYKLIGRHISENFKDANRIYRPKDIISDIHREFNITISYNKAFDTMHYGFGLIRGFPEDSYVKLPHYCYVLEEKNPGTVTFIETDEKGHFKYFFMALGPCIRGFRSSIRRVISVDGTFLSSRYGGTLLIATSQDANRQIYPIAWAIVDSENSASWLFFFQRLRDITGDTSDLVIVSDRGTSIPGAFHKVFTHAHHGYCNYHSIKNLKAEFPRLQLDGLYWATAEAYTLHSFETNMEALCSRREGIRGYLERAGLHHWARAHFQATRFNIMTTNNTESMNATLKRAREFPILGLIENIRETLQRWFHERHVASRSCSSILTQPYEEKMRTSYNESDGLVAKHVTMTTLQVSGRSRNYVVNLEKGACTCRKFEMDQFPCEHAISAIRFCNDNGYNFCSTFFTSSCWRNAYSEPINPLPIQNEWVIPEEVMSKIVLPQLSQRSKGRPTYKRKKSAGEPRKKQSNGPRQIRKCSKCGGPGHNRGTCTQDPSQ